MTDIKEKIERVLMRERDVIKELHDCLDSALDTKEGREYIRYIVTDAEEGKDSFDKVLKSFKEYTWDILAG